MATPLFSETTLMATIRQLVLFLPLISSGSVSASICSFLRVSLKGLGPPSIAPAGTRMAFLNNALSNNMPRGVKKENLPTKICVVCERPFNWRKKWERCWDKVTTCSKSCNRKRRETNRGLSIATALAIANYSSDANAENENFPAHHEESKILMTSVDVNTDEDNKSFWEVADDEIEIASLFQERLGLDDDEQSTASQSSTESGEAMDAKARRKAEKKRKKAERRAQREGRGDPSAGQKHCTICTKSVNLLIRCTYDKSGEWGMVCGKCWKDVSGGVVDGDANHPYYRYGGVWKNRRAQSK
mmetsp:Transcript_8833/g.18519  ORF Transcript_8833/g.18519 Transcript_8833/m.18519 type:complete len:301 (-) Transcript_8833:132-1034(-)